mmetsp:Transcript_34553/g.95167  ORF Transcript_34553/g.95167 Transcript_34553/m.95167 type:complete len:265 (-) Transcript_34553:587-1381(-)
MRRRRAGERIPRTVAFPILRRTMAFVDDRGASLATIGSGLAIATTSAGETPSAWLPEAAAWRSTAIRVMLSHPSPMFAAGWRARLVSRNAAQAAEMDVAFGFFKPCLPTFAYPSLRNKNLTTNWLLAFSQIPSHPRTSNLSFSRTRRWEISGSQMILCSFGFSLLLLLYAKSPNARDKLRFPSTRPPISTSVMKPPAFLIRVRSTCSVGLWSRDKATTRSPCDNTQRESPAFATQSSAPSPNRTSATTAVVPMQSGPSPLTQRW